MSALTPTLVSLDGTRCAECDAPLFVRDGRTWRPHATWCPYAYRTGGSTAHVVVLVSVPAPADPVSEADLDALDALDGAEHHPDDQEA